MTIYDAGRQLVLQLSGVYDEREAKNIADWVMEHLTGLTRIDRVIHKDKSLSNKEKKTLAGYTRDLLAHKPVQYILHEAWFYGMKLYVDENVLIPRPETEELVDWVVAEARERGNPAILDIGTGSGCIALGLKKGLPGASVTACDISAGALSVAQRNAGTQQLDIAFGQLDFLSEKGRSELPLFDIVVSNPPYIPIRDKTSMAANVLDYEPHLALFVENNDPLLYYKVIAEFAHTHLSKEGAIYLEIYEGAGATVTSLFQQAGFANTSLRKDLQERDRMIKAMK
ncbi:MAG: peptide chain release factor N(5)-glutamine methyltransferase [Bacteroidetes bacterium]|nr:peptide chain release factor N(5)-glutamine methyltransferase [Bacteroidota bacterium]